MSKNFIFSFIVLVFVALLVFALRPDVIIVRAQSSSCGSIGCAACPTSGCSDGPEHPLYGNCLTGEISSSWSSMPVRKLLAEAGWESVGATYVVCGEHCGAFEPQPLTCVDEQICCDPPYEEMCWNKAGYRIDTDEICGSSGGGAPLYRVCIHLELGGICPGGGGGDDGSCDLRWPDNGPSTCPTECNIGDTFDISYEFRTDSIEWDESIWLYRDMLTWDYYYTSASWRQQSCEDDERYFDTDWYLETKNVSCDDFMNKGGENNFKLGCYSDDDGVYAGGSWCEDESPGYNSNLSCKIDVLCTPDTSRSCCNSSGDLYSNYLADDTATLGVKPGLNCLGAVVNSCWGASFGFPDAQNGEIYNGNCCGDDIGEYFVSDFGIMQASVTITNEDRSCDGTIACCRSDSGAYDGYVESGQCVDSCSTLSIGHIRIQGPSGMIKLNIISAADAIAAGNGVLKVAMTVGDTNSAADLVLASANDPDASPVRIRTPQGIMAWRKLD